jgi:hypothetical protein
MLKREDPYLGLRERAKRLDQKKTKYPWKDLVVWSKNDSVKNTLRRELGSVLYFGMLGLIFVIAFATPIGSSGAFPIILLAMWFLPFMIEWLQRVALAPYIVGRKIVHMSVRHCGEGKTYEIRDEIVRIRRIPYRSNPASSNPKARNRAGLQLEFRNHFQIGSEIHKHIFDSIAIFGNSRHMRSLDTLAMNYRIKTDIYGIEMFADVYELSVKIDESVWDEATNQYVCSSWATKETGESIKIITPVLVVGSEEKIYDCPTCSTALSFDELIQTDRFSAKQEKARKIQAEIGKIYAEETKDAVTERDFRAYEEAQFHDRYYKKPFWSRMKIPNWKWYEWVAVIVFGIIISAALFPQIRAFFSELWFKLGGGL